MVRLVKDPCGIICIILAWVMLIFSHYALLTVVILPQDDSPRKYLNILILELFFVLAIVSHFKTIFTDPGSTPINAAPLELVLEVKSTYPPGSVEYRCYECNSLKPRGTHHCSVCKRCITRMDHHCPWINNCVGEKNQKHFILFILYISILSIHALILSIGYFYDCLETSHDDASNTSCSMLNKSGKASPGNLIMLVILTFESLLFSLFTAIMFCVQMKSLWTNRKYVQSSPPPTSVTTTSTSSTSKY